jgi:hypothetical protein
MKKSDLFLCQTLHNVFPNLFFRGTLPTRYCPMRTRTCPTTVLLKQLVYSVIFR